VTKVVLRREREREGQRSTGNIGSSSGRNDPEMLIDRLNLADQRALATTRGRNLAMRRPLMRRPLFPACALELTFERSTQRFFRGTLFPFLRALESQWRLPVCGFSPCLPCRKLAKLQRATSQDPRRGPSTAEKLVENAAAISPECWKNASRVAQGPGAVQRDAISS